MLHGSSSNRCSQFLFAVCLAAEVPAMLRIVSSHSIALHCMLDGAWQQQQLMFTISVCGLLSCGGASHAEKS
jgi:hypothetical protein